MQNKPNSGQPDRCSGEAIVRNKANSPIADCAKQTQLPGGTGRDGARGAGDEGQMRKTNPICPAGPGGVGRGMLYKQSQFPAERQKG
jgi:hypothetical protein